MPCGPTSLLVKINPSEHLIEQTPHKDITVYVKLKADKWEEWEEVERGSRTSEHSQPS